MNRHNARIPDEVTGLTNPRMVVDSGLGTGSQADALPQILDTLVDDGEITPDQADGFLDIHDRLIEAGLME